jgi:hypothetical protein
LGVAWREALAQMWHKGGLWSTVVSGTVCLGVLLSPWTPGVAGQAPGETPVLVKIAPPVSMVSVSGTVGIDVEVDNVEGLYGVDVRFTFDPELLAVVDANQSRPGIQVQPGTFLTGAGSYFAALNAADNAAGTVAFALTLLNPAQPVSGSGAVVHIDFRALRAGTGVLHFTSVVLVDRNADTMLSVQQDGEINASAAPVSKTIWIPLIIR